MESPLRIGAGGRDITAAVNHSIVLGGTKHASGYCEPMLRCAACHGDSLQGGARGEPSCTGCHADRWSGAGCGTTTHTINLGGSLHAPDYCLPGRSCAQCHGSDLRGGSSGEPSCYSCHGAEWNDCGE